MIKYFKLGFLIFFCLSAAGQNMVKPVTGSFTDLRDKKTYRTVSLGSQTWFGQNLNFKCSGSWCYDDSFEYSKTYGRLYSQDAALTACPAGWHLPSSVEWIALINALGGKSVAGGALKETGTDRWLHPNEKASNSSGMKMLPAGFRDALTGNFFRMGEETIFRSSTKLNNSDNFSWTFFLEYSSNAAFIENITLSDNKNGYSVRCIKNTLSNPKN